MDNSSFRWVKTHLHRHFRDEIMCSVPIYGHEYISEESIMNFLRVVDEIAYSLNDYHREDISPKRLLSQETSEVHAICTSLYAMGSGHYNTINHSYRVAEHSVRIAKELKRFGVIRVLSDERIRKLYLAGSLHDIGKLFFQNNFLYDGRSYDEPQRVVVNTHVHLGFLGIEYTKCQIPKLEPILTDIGRTVLEHHERMDGKGYPEGKPGKYISIDGRTMKVADSFDSMVYDKTRTYKGLRELKTPKQAIDEMLTMGHEYDPDIVRACRRMVRKNHFIRLSNSFDINVIDPLIDYFDKEVEELDLTSS